MLHYICIISYTPETELEIVSDTMELLLVQKKLPKLSPSYAVTSAPADLIEALQNPAPYIPIPQLGS